MIVHPLILDFSWRPVVQPGLVLLMAVALVGLAVLAYLRLLHDRPALGAGLLVTRVIGLLAIIVLLLGLSSADPAAPVTVKRSLTVLLDTSASMQTADYNGRSRFEIATKDWLSNSNLEWLGKEFDLHIMTFDDGLHPMPATLLKQPEASVATGRQSRIAECLRQAMAQLPPVGNPPSGSDMLVISDGRDTDGESFGTAASLAAARKIRVHTVALGGVIPERRMAMLALPSQDSFLAGEPGSILVRVYQVGLDNTSATLHVRSPNGESTIPLKFTTAPMITATVPIKHEAAGIYKYELWLDPIAGESPGKVALQTVFVDVTGKRIQALLLEGEPGWDSKFIAQALREDERIDLTTVSQIAPGKRVRIATRSNGGGDAWPISLTQLGKYDVIILGRGIASLLEPAVVAALPGYVSNGGHLIFARGQAYLPTTVAEADAAKALHVVEPAALAAAVARPGDFPLAVTPAGRGQSLLTFCGQEVDADDALIHLPHATAILDNIQLKTSSQVLLQTHGEGNEQNPRPAIVSMEYGHGGVVAVLAEGLWRWRLLPPSLQKWSGVYDALWSNIVRRLVLGGEFQPGQSLSLKLSPTSVRLGDEVSFSVAARQEVANKETPLLDVIDDYGVSQRVLLTATDAGRWKGVFRPPVAGVYRAVLGGSPPGSSRIDRPFSVYDVDVERMQVSANPAALAKLAEQTGGLSLRPDQADALPRLLDAMSVSRPGPPKTRWAWDSPWLLAVLLGWMGVEWFVRRRSGWL